MRLSLRWPRLPYALTFKAQPGDHQDRHAATMRSWAAYWFSFVERVAVVAVLKAAGEHHWLAAGLYWISAGLVALPIATWVQRFHPLLRVQRGGHSRRFIKIAIAGLKGLHFLIFFLTLAALNYGVGELVEAVRRATTN